MLRKTFIRFLTINDLTDRMDSFEREMIELKSFRNAVEVAAPKVAVEAKRATEERLKECKSNASHLDIPLTAGEFTVLNRFYAAQKLMPVPMENLMYISKPNDLVAHASAVHREYLVRMAKRARQLSLAPYGLSQMPSILELKKYYQLSFHDMRNTSPPTTTEDLIKFDNLVRRVFLRHYNVSTLLCEGMRELSQREQWSSVNVHLRDAYPDLQDFFEEFSTERVKLRLLIGNYMYLSNQILKVDPATYRADDPHNLTTQLLFGHAREDFVGQISRKTSLVTLLKDAISSLQPSYEDAEICLKIAGDDSLTFVGIPYIIHDIMSALLDDAVQTNLARQELYGVPCSNVEVTLSQNKNNENFSFLVSDTAGGIPLDSSDLMLTCWSAYKLFESEYKRKDKHKTWVQSPIKLAYANCAARVFGGKMSYAAIDGYGCDRQVTFPSKGILGISI